MQHRVTIRDVAARAGVSAGAVSLALNGRPGVSEATRRRIAEAARDLGWSPNLAARSLARSPGVHTIGMAISREAVAEGLDALHMALIGGIESVLSERPCSLLLRLTAGLESEIALYKQWWQSGRVNGAVLTGVVAEDPRIQPVHRLGMPVVVVAHPDHSGPFPAVWSDDAAATAEAVRYLAVLGHRRIAHVAGPARLGSSLVRSRAFEEVAVELSLDDHRSVPTDLSAHEGARVTRALLVGADRPTAILYDNDIMAVAGLAVAAELGLRVPEDVSLVAWDDSDLCRITRPALSALSHDPFAFGSEVAHCLLELLDTGKAESRISGTPVLVPRGTTGLPPRRP
ncbi:LacI family transcriptional regulator [Kitasatospora herbaricolor]|uniref:LacI family DNA-binding transcriptional regulator n=1 Tax=Kitasatospora herbaricolor TaxID=68217 RepID=UPI00174DD548|nr:LacI family DNA-binding transcriptional regulator [Kitasatospora herbaricolor]MDQ0306752.1 DNA-binding LacI/PurR family transcriptional regulator [Kitasatospora herbaricolor]GGV44482.1 LacI family transcriptional regulator [Kitasatospora herbaricolor]